MHKYNLSSHRKHISISNFDTSILILHTCLLFIQWLIWQACCHWNIVDPLLYKWWTFHHMKFELPHAINKSIVQDNEPRFRMATKGFTHEYSSL
jgi:hypothetical protein